MSAYPRGFAVSFGAFCVLYACISFLLSVLVSLVLFVVLGTAFVAFVSYFRLPAPSRQAVESILGVDYTAHKAYEAERAVAGGNDEKVTPSGLLVPVVAHRGACLDAPENSLAAFRLVKERGVHCVELDVSLTKDGIAIVFHDDVVDRVTSGSGRISNMTFEDVRKLELSSKFIFPDKFPNEKIPTLSEALDLCLDLDLRMMIDVKDPNPAVAYAVLAEYRRRPELKRKALVSSFYHNIIYLVRLADPDIVCSMAVRPAFFAYQDFIPGTGPVNPRFDSIWKHWAAILVDQVVDWGQYTFTPYFLGLSAILASQAFTDPARLTHWRNQGLRVFIWTVNDPLAKRYCNEYLRVPYLTDTLEV